MMFWKRKKNLSLANFSSKDIEEHIAFFEALKHARDSAYAENKKAVGKFSNSARGVNIFSDSSAENIVFSPKSIRVFFESAACKKKNASFPNAALTFRTNEIFYACLNDLANRVEMLEAMLNSPEKQEKESLAARSMLVGNLAVIALSLLCAVSPFLPADKNPNGEAVSKIISATLLLNAISRYCSGS